MGYYISRPVEDAVERIMDAQDKLAEKYKGQDLPLLLDFIEESLAGKTKNTMTPYDEYLLDQYWEIFSVLNPEYEGEYHRWRR